MVTKKDIPCLTSKIRMDLESLKILLSSRFWLNFLLGLIQSMNAFMISLECAHATELTKLSL